MITLPWQLVFALVGLVGLGMILNHLKKENCTERIEAAVREARRDARSDYRKSFLMGWNHAQGARDEKPDSDA